MGHSAVSTPDQSFQIDRQALIDHYPKGGLFIDQLFTTIRRTTQDVPHQLRDAAQRGDLTQVRALAHNTKGMAANLLINDLRWLASHVENHCVSDPEVALTSACALADAVEAMLGSLDLG